MSHWDRIFSEFFSLPLPVLCHRGFILIHMGGCTLVPFETAVQRGSLTPSTRLASRCNQFDKCVINNHELDMMVGCDCITSVLICAYNSRWYNSYITTSFNENVIGPSFSILFPLISSLLSLLHLFCVLP
jgi:hypothetical protein